MSEAKFQVGDEVHVPGITDPLTIVAVETCYRFSPNGALWREEELTPYVRPLAVGDRVRCKADHAYSGVIDAIRDGKACLWRSYMAWDTMQIQYLERIPTEAGK